MEGPAEEEAAAPPTPTGGVEEDGVVIIGAASELTDDQNGLPQPDGPPPGETPDIPTGEASDDPKASRRIFGRQKSLTAFFRQSTEPKVEQEHQFGRRIRTFFGQRKGATQPSVAPTHGTPTMRQKLDRENRDDGIIVPTKPKVVNCFSEESMTAEVTSFVMRCIIDKLNEGPTTKAVVGLSGGQTPRAVYTSMALASASPDGFPVEWNRVFFFLVDERYVEADAPQSNLKMIRETLFSEGSAIKQEQLIYPKTNLPIDDCVREYHNELHNLFGLAGKADVVVLGMGTDTHTASWFPPLSETDVALAYDPCRLAAHTRTENWDIKDRITVSMAILVRARKKVLSLAGEDKVKTWRELVASDAAVEAQPMLQIARSGDLTVVSSPPIEVDEIVSYHNRWEQHHLSLVVLGASGDLAKKKTFPALFHLFCEGHLPCNSHIVGFARSELDFETFWTDSLLPYIENQELFYSHRCDLRKRLHLSAGMKFVERFKEKIRYLGGVDYTAPDSFSQLDAYLKGFEHSENNHRLFYLALPPHIFGDAVDNLYSSAWSKTGWNRVVVEKPFGRDAKSSSQLSNRLMISLKEEEIFRIDHYLGKEMVLNMLYLRFANVVFAPVWHRHSVSCVRITFKEDIGTEGRGGYFDQYGIIRDIMQNHLLQLLTLVAMERPASLADDDVRDEKVKVLKQMMPIKMEDCVLGQYTGSSDGSKSGYLEDKGVPENSRCPTFACAAMFINNERWHNVPFIMKAGKALEERLTEIRLQLREVPGAGLFSPKLGVMQTTADGALEAGAELAQNEIVIKIQPREAVYMKLLLKKPGLGEALEETELDLSVADRFDLPRLPDAYERLIFDVIRGDKQNFVRTDELREAWRVFTPLLHEIETKKTKPVSYQFGSKGPSEAYDLIKRFGYIHHYGYVWKKV